MDTLKSTSILASIIAQNPYHIISIQGQMPMSHAEIIDYYINFLEKPETLYTFTEKPINFLKTLIK
jgi:hypothetical protein